MKKDKLEHLNRKITKAFHRKYGKLVLGHGNTNANIMLIGEAPGRQEEEQGRPFIGRSGKLLDKALVNAGVDRKRIYITNVVKCRTIDLNKLYNKYYTKIKATNRKCKDDKKRNSRKSL